MGKVIKKQHYVFRAYLKPWAREERIFCLRAGKVFLSNLEGVACERYFYRGQDLPPREVQFFEEIFSGHHSEQLKAIQKRFMATYLFPMKLRARLGNNIDPKVRSTLDAVINEGLEHYHQRIEDDLVHFVREMLEGRTDFYADSQQAAVFCMPSVSNTRGQNVQ